MHNFVLKGLASLKDKKKKVNKKGSKRLHIVINLWCIFWTKLQHVLKSLITTSSDYRYQGGQEVHSRTVKLFVSQPLYTFHYNSFNINFPSDIYVYPKETGKSGHPIIISLMSSHTSQVADLGPGGDKKPPSSHLPIPKSGCTPTLMLLSKLWTS